MVGRWSEPDYEAVATLHPDLLLAYGRYPGPEAEAKLAAAGIPILRLEVYMTNTWSAYLQDAWKLPANVTLYGGARLDYWVTYAGRSGNIGAVQSIPSSDWAEISPRVAAVWNPLKDSVLRASVSKGFRAPNLYEMLRSWTSAGTSPITYLPNANLKPETLWTYELSGTQYFWNRRVKLGAAVFHTNFWNYIDSVNVSSYVKQQQNIGRLEINGLEFEGEFKPWQFLTLWGNLTFNEPRIKKYSQNPALNGKYLSGVPLMQANLGTDITWRQFKASLAGNFAGRNYANSNNNDQENVYGGNTQVWLWDAKLTYSPTKYTDVSFSVQNLFDQQYYSYYAGSPRTYMTAAARHLSGKAVKTYYGDTREPEHVEVRDLADEVRRVVRTKLLHPAWIEGMAFLCESSYARNCGRSCRAQPFRNP